MKKYIIGSIGVLAILVGIVSIERIPAGYVGVTNLTIMDSTNTMKVIK